MCMGKRDRHKLEAEAAIFGMDCREWTGIIEYAMIFQRLVKSTHKACRETTKDGKEFWQ